MDFSTAIHVYEHFLNIDESLQLSINDYPDVDKIQYHSEHEVEFTYYDFVYKDHLEIRAMLDESNITNLDAHYMLKKFIQKFIESKSERSKNQLSKPFTYDSYLILADEEQEDEDESHSNYFMETIVDMIEYPQYLFEFIAEFGTFNVNPKYAKYPYKQIENNGQLPYIIASYLSHLPFKIYAHKIDYDVKFTSYQEVIEWQNNLMWNPEGTRQSWTWHDATAPEADRRPRCHSRRP